MSASAVRATSSDDKFVRIAEAEAEAKRVAGVKARATALAAEHQADVQHGRKIERAREKLKSLLSRADDIVEPFKTVDALVKQAGEIMQAGLTGADEWRRGVIDCCQVLAVKPDALFAIHFRIEEMLLQRALSSRIGDFGPLFTGIISREDYSLAASAEHTVNRLCRTAQEITQ